MKSNNHLYFKWIVRNELIPENKPKLKPKKISFHLISDKNIEEVDEKWKI